MTRSEAPGLTWSAPTRAFWRCPSRFVRAGYSVTRIRLPGQQGDGLDDERARLCRDYTREAERWFDGLDTPKVPLGSWKHLIARYQVDEFSPIRDVKAVTRDNYLWLLGRWEEAIGHLEIRDLDYEEIRRIERKMREKGRSDSYVHRMFTMLRTVASYGKALRVPGARDVSETLSEMRFKIAPGRTIAPTRAQIEQIVAAADARGMHGFAFGLLCQFELTLRAVDIFGQWLPDDGDGGGILRAGKRWQDGLTWDMVEPDLTGFSKVISKTARSMPDPIRFDLSALPEIQSRLRLLGNEGRVGPVVTTERSGMPYTRNSRSQAFRRLRDACGLSKEITMMDTRAGAVTEAKEMGVDPFLRSRAAQHKSVATTEGYTRDRSGDVAKVIQIRRGEQK